MTAEQKQKLADLFAKEHVAVLITQGEQWPTGTMQAFAETPELEIVFIVGATAEKYQNLLKHPNANRRLFRFARQIRLARENLADALVTLLRSDFP